MAIVICFAQYAPCGSRCKLCHDFVDCIDVGVQNWFFLSAGCLSEDGSLRNLGGNDHWLVLPCSLFFHPLCQRKMETCITDISSYWLTDWFCHRIYSTNWAGTDQESECRVTQCDNRWKNICGTVVSLLFHRCFLFKKRRKKIWMMKKQNRLQCGYLL